MNRAGFSRLPGNPLPTPADRLDALQRVAAAARVVVATGNDADHFDDLDDLEIAVKALGEIERRQGEQYAEGEARS